MITKFQSFEAVKWYDHGKFIKEEEPEDPAEIEYNDDYIIVKFGMMCDPKFQRGKRFYAKKIDSDEIILNFDTLELRDFKTGNFMPLPEYDKVMIMNGEYIISNGYDINSQFSKLIEYKDLIKKVNIKIWKE